MKLKINASSKLTSWWELLINVIPNHLANPNDTFLMNFFNNFFYDLY